MYRYVPPVEKCKRMCSAKRNRGLATWLGWPWGSQSSCSKLPACGVWRCEWHKAVLTIAQGRSVCKQQWFWGNLLRERSQETSYLSVTLQHSVLLLPRPTWASLPGPCSLCDLFPVSPLSWPLPGLQRARSSWKGLLNLQVHKLWNHKVVLTFFFLSPSNISKEQSVFATCFSFPALTAFSFCHFNETVLSKVY